VPSENSAHRPWGEPRTQNTPLGHCRHDEAVPDEQAPWRSIIEIADDMDASAIVAGITGRAATHDERSAAKPARSGSHEPGRRRNVRSAPGLAAARAVARAHPPDLSLPDVRRGQLLSLGVQFDHDLRAEPS